MTADVELSFVEQLARAAGALLRRYQVEGFTINYKAAIDLVTTADHESEKLILDALTARYPSHAIISEEKAPSPRPAVALLPDWERGWGEGVWYVDPLDGTTSFAHRYPSFAVSIALYENDQPLLGAIYDPSRDELFSAQRGAGAWLNGERIAVSQTRSLIESLLTSGFPYDVHESGGNVSAFQQLTLLSRGVRISGAAALDFAWVACGRLDGYWEPVIAPWDGAAGALIVREAGGRASNYADEEWQPTMQSIIVSNGLLHARLREAILNADAEGRT